MDLGLRFLRMLFLLGGMGVFAGMNSWFLWQIWAASSSGPVDLNQQAVYGASTLGGVLGTFFASVLGISVAIGKGQKLGETLLPDLWQSQLLATLAIWLYAAVGAAAVTTVFFNQDQSPQSIKALASVFAGFALAVFIAAFSPQARPGGGATQAGGS